MILLRFATGEWVSRIVICRITDLFITTCCRWHEFILAYKTNLHRFVRRRTGSLKVVKWFGKSRCVQSGCRYYQKQGIEWLRWKQRFVIMRPSVTYHTTTWLRNTSPAFRYAFAILTLPGRTHPMAYRMSGPFWKDLDISHYFGTPFRTVGYSLYLGTTSDDTIFFIIPHSYPYVFMIFYLMLFITISLDLFHLKHSFTLQKVPWA